MSIIKRAASGPISMTSTTILDWLNIKSDTASGETVTSDSALGLSAFYRGTDLISNTVAAAPLVVKRRKDLEIITNDLLANPSQMLSEYEFWHLVTSRIILHGNFYALKQRFPGKGPRSMPRQLLPVNPENVTVKGVVNKKGLVIERFYEVTIHHGSIPTGKAGQTSSTTNSSNAEIIQVPPEDMLHIMDLSVDGIIGRSRVHALREPLGTIQATDRYAANLFGKGGLFTGVLQTDARLTEEMADSLRQRWRSKLAGLDNSHEVAILDQGAKFIPMSMTAEDSQFIAAREFNVKEAARILGVPQHLLYEGEGSDGIEQLSQEFVRFTMNAFAKRISSRLNKDILPTTEMCQFDFTDLVAPDMRTQAQASQLWRKANVLTINEIREEKGYERIEDPKADDVFFVAEDKVGGASLGDNMDQTHQQDPSESTPGDGEDATEVL